MPADLPVAAPDHADEIRAALKALRGWLPEPQNKVASGGYDAEIVKVRRAHKAGLAALGALLAERQQDKERIERLETALSVYADPRHWAISRDDLAMRVVSWIGPGATTNGLPDAMETARAALAADALCGAATRDATSTPKGSGRALPADPVAAPAVTYCECYGDPEGAPLCDECKAEERERDEERAADLFDEDVRLYGIR